ncbi:MAG: poly-beta-1,6-N-acetyl-D-glucosamine biosynthesis protein PgaD [Arhodomonas sp.]|nr:poly-beta-1,6-N-acetyl-D-glucosamine biosynthesis protein PgaD [Arhodomonas sp.]
MSESRPRIPPIIDQPSLEPPARRRLSQLINLAGWIAYVYLLTPAFGLLGWFLGVELFAGHVLGDPFDTLLAIRVYTVAILIAAAIFLGWAGYNWIRFRDVERRRAPRAAQQRRAGTTLPPNPRRAAGATGRPHRHATP